MEAVILIVCTAMAIAWVYVVCGAIIALVRWAPVLIAGILAAAASSALGADGFSLLHLPHARLWHCGFKSACAPGGQ